MLEIQGQPFPRRREWRQLVKDTTEGNWRGLRLEVESKETATPGVMLRSWRAFHPYHRLNGFRVVAMPGGALAVYGDTLGTLFRTEEMDPAPWAWANAAELDVMMAAAVRPGRVFLPAEAEAVLQDLEADPAMKPKADGIRAFWQGSGLLEWDAWAASYAQVMETSDVPDCRDWDRDALAAVYALQWLVQHRSHPG